MQLDEALYRAFLEQMQELENFRMSYAAAHPSVPMDRDDPDVRRLIEALAFFSARTHRAGMRNIVDSQLRIFQQCFPYLLTPLPAMGLLRAGLTGRFAETVFLPAGCEFVFSSPDGGSAVFRTLHDLRILPLTLNRVGMALLPGEGFRLFLHLEAPYERSEDIGRLSFYINHLNNYKASLRVFHTLKECIRKAVLVFDESDAEGAAGGLPCELSFGPPAGEALNDWFNPLLKERFFFHFPQQELFLNVHCPTPPRNWRRIVLRFDLDAKWPRNLILNREIFHLHAVPVMNLKRAMAQPITCDGTREEHAIRHPDTEKGLELQMVTGVYQVAAQGMVPLRPGILAGGNGSYEIRQAAGLQSGGGSRLFLNFPETVEKSRTIAVDALWLQPGFSKMLGQRLNVTPYNRDITGLVWEHLGDISPHAANDFASNTETFLNLFTLKNKSELSLDDLLGLLQAMGNIMQGEFKGVADLLTGMRLEQAPARQAGRQGALRRIYYLCFAKLDPAFMPLVETFMFHVGRILDGWLPEAAIEMRLEEKAAKGLSERAAKG